MPVHIERMDRGLYTAIDPAFSPPGALREALNTRYRTGDTALWHAEGRTQIGGGAYDSQVVDQVVGLSWDPGTVAVANKPELQQILYVSRDAEALRSVPAKDDPTDVELQPSNARTYTPADGTQIPSSLGDVVSFSNEYFITTGAEPLWMRRTAAGQELRGHGMPRTPVATFVYTRIPGVVNPFPAGDYFYWFTWYNTDTLIEGAVALEVEAGENVNHESQTGTDDALQIEISILLFDANKPAKANAVRVYRSKVAPLGTPSAFPNGYLIATNSLPLPTVGAGPRATRYILATDTHASFPDSTLELVANIYPRVVVGIEGYSIPTSRRGPPPLATTGDVFQESLVLNDVSDRRKVRYSYPNEPHYFPTPFYINFETRDTDSIVGVRALGNVLGVLLTNSVWRVNWLPTSSDFDFSRGRVKDLVCEGFGADNRRCVSRFDMPGQGPMIAFANRTGIYATDLFQWVELTQHIDFKNMVGSTLSNCVLVNNPDEWRLEFYYPGDSHDQPNACMYLHYHPTHVREGQLAITGPMRRPGGLSTAAPIRLESGRRRTVSGDPRGNLYYEGLGTDDAAEPFYTLTFFAESRDIYPAGFGGEITVDAMLTHFKPGAENAGPVNAVMKVHPNKNFVYKIDPLEYGQRGLKLTTGVARGEYVTLSVTQTSVVGSGINAMGFSWDSLGPTERRGPE